ncbi:MAG: M55 family metallopeptidase, partial [Terriglobia bacterium]
QEGRVPMPSTLRGAAACVLLLLAVGLPLFGQAVKPVKVLVIADLEGVDGVFNFDLQCIPFKSPLYPESRKALTNEVKAAVEGIEDGANHRARVVVYDNHYGGHNLSSLDMPSGVKLLSGSPVSPTLGLDASYSAIMFVGLHSMAGTKDGVLPHSFTWNIQNIWVNGTKAGEIGSRVMLGGELGIPAVMLAGDAAACREYLALVPQGECAQVKTGESHTGGYSLTDADACALIKAKAEDAITHLAEIKPYAMHGPAEVKAEFTNEANPSFPAGPGVEQTDGRTWVFRGPDFIHAWLKFRTF